MADDQLSWETLLGGKALSGDEARAPSEGASAPPVAAAPKTIEVVKIETASVSKRSAPAQTLEAQEPVAAWDWSSLTVSKASVPAIVSEPADSEPAKKKPAARRASKTKADSDLPATTGSEPTVISVSDLNRAIKGQLEGNFSLIWVRGEISNFKAHTSGHFYFSLKDSKCQVSAVMFRGFNAGLKFRPSDGMEVLVRGKITVFEPRGNYQIFCETMEPVGAGALQQAYEQLKARLNAEGLFDPARKRALPQLPRHIAIVTSPTGAAIRDMLNVLGRRFKAARITLVPAKVQGDAAPGEIVAAIQLVNGMTDVDVLIVGRGGGSIEDLWAFNDERVARAISSARAPTISAVGHEIDFTIADFVADLRAPTPSAAAELVVRNAADLAGLVAARQRSLQLAFARRMQGWKQTSAGLGRRLVDPRRRLQDMSMRCDELAQRLEASVARSFQNRRMGLQLLREQMGNPLARIASERKTAANCEARLRTGVRNLVDRKRQQLINQGALLDSLSPLKVVERGYSIVTLQGHVVKDADQLGPASEIDLQFARGRATAKIVSTKID